MEQNRREFLLAGWKLGGALLIGAAGYTAYEALRPLTTGAGGGKVNLGEAKSFEDGTATYFPEGRLYAVNATARGASSARATARSSTSPASGSKGLPPAGWTGTGSR